MKAWQFVDDGQPLTLNDVNEPTAGPDEVVIDVKAAGLCHSDVGFLDGTLTSVLAFRPMTLGHEVAGVISEVGPNVTNFSIGDRVAIAAKVEGIAGSHHGGYAAKVVSATEWVVPIPDGVPWNQAAAATDAGMTSYNAVMDRGQVRAGMKVGVIGLGGLGSLGAQIANAAGASVYVAEINEAVHEFARNLDGVAGVSTTIHDFAAEGLDVIIDFAGTGTTTADAVEAVKDGGRVVLVGLAVAEGTIPLLTLVLKSVDLVGSQTGNPEHVAAVLEMIAAGKVVSRISDIDFDSIKDGLDRLARHEVTGRLVAVY